MQYICWRPQCSPIDNASRRRPGEGVKIILILSYNYKYHLLGHLWVCLQAAPLPNMPSKRLSTPFMHRCSFQHWTSRLEDVLPWFQNQDHLIFSSPWPRRLQSSCLQLLERRPCSMQHISDSKTENWASNVPRSGPLQGATSCPSAADLWGVCSGTAWPPILCWEIGRSHSLLPERRRLQSGEQCRPSRDPWQHLRWELRQWTQERRIVSTWIFLHIHPSRLSGPPLKATFVHSYRLRTIL